MRKLAFCICENKDADQLCGNREAHQRLCYNSSTTLIRNFKPLAIFCGCTARFVSDLVGNPEDRFSHNKALIILFTAAPKIDMPMSDVTVMPGDSVVFNCEADGDPAPFYKWYINGILLKGKLHGSFYYTSHSDMVLVAIIILQFLAHLRRRLTR